VKAFFASHNRVDPPERDEGVSGWTMTSGRCCALTPDERPLSSELGGLTTSS